MFGTGKPINGKRFGPVGMSSRSSGLFRMHTRRGLTRMRQELIPTGPKRNLCGLRGLAVNYSVLRIPFVVVSVRKRIRLSGKIGLFVG